MGRVLLIELNEFNQVLLKSAATTYRLKNIQRLFELTQTATFTADAYDSGYLEPWVQWVSVHTGVPSTLHRIKHLGDASQMAHEQLWEVLSGLGVTSGIWGPLNATRGKAEKCRFFLPDPWTFSESGYPKELNRFLDLPRYMARNYLKPSWLHVARLLLGFARFIVAKSTLIPTLVNGPRVLLEMIRYRGANFVAYSFAEYLSTLRFLDYKKKYDCDFNLLFLNLIAHVQHYYWKGNHLEELPQFRFAFGFLDKILGAVFASLEADEIVFVTNGLSQTNTNAEKPWILYRQIDHRQLLEAIGMRDIRIEACMTHDAHIFFADAEAALKAHKILSEASIGADPLFHVETYADNPTKLFYSIKFTGKLVAEATYFEANQLKLPFGQFFKEIVERTGKHNGSGVVFSTHTILPGKMPNHGLFQHIQNCWQPKFPTRNVLDSPIDTKLKPGHVT